MNDGRTQRLLKLHTPSPLSTPPSAGAECPQTPRGVEIEGSITLPCQSVVHDVDAHISHCELRGRMLLSGVHLQCFHVTGMLHSLVTYRLLSHARRNRSQYPHPARPHPG